MNLHFCKHNLVPKCHFTQEDIPPTAKLQKDWSETVIAENSINQHSGMQRFLTKNVVVKSFPVGTSEDMEDFNRTL